MSVLIALNTLNTINMQMFNLNWSYCLLIIGLLHYLLKMHDRGKFITMFIQKGPQMRPYILQLIQCISLYLMPLLTDHNYLY